MFKSTNKSIKLRMQSQKKLREMKLRRLSTKTEKQAIWVLIEALREEVIILEKKRQRHLNAPSRSQKSPWLMEMDQSRVLWLRPKY